MKIASNDFLEQIRNGAKPKNGVDQTDQGFSKLLEERQSAPSTGGSTTTTGPGSVAGLDQSPLLGMILANQSVGDKAAKVDQQLESTLDKMEQYANALGDSSKNLKDIEPLAQDLEKAAGQLTEMSRGLPEDNPLKSMSNDTAVLATVEAMKFRRGDYV